MSTTTKYIIDLQEEEMRSWICEHLEVEDADEDTPGWDDLALEWSYMQSNYEEYYEQNNWYVSHSYSEIHRTFQFQLQNLKELVDTSVATIHEETFYKMVYGHAVTLMESFLADTVRSLIIKNDNYFLNAISNVDCLKKEKFSLLEITKQKDGAKGFAITELSKVMYHNVSKVRNILSAIVGKKIIVDIATVSTITNLRHDIVHRDGKTTDGKLIKVDREIVMKAIDSIECFVNTVSAQLDSHNNA